MNKVIFSHPKELMPENTLMSGKPELFDKLRLRGLDPYVTMNSESAFNDEGVEVHELIDDHNALRVGEVALSDVSIIVNRLNRSIKKEDMPESWLEANLPIVNENELRSLAHRKHRMHEEVFEPLGLGMDTVLIESLVDAAIFVETHPAEAYIAKPTSGTFSKGVDRLRPQDVVSYFGDDERLGSVILQPAFDFTKPLPEYIKAYDGESRDDFQKWANSSFVKELRMYGFYGDGRVDAFPVGRAMTEGEDHWFFVDPETIPSEVYDNTEKVFLRSAKLTGSRAIYGALDMAYGSYKSGEDPDYHIVEFNGRMPYMIGYDKHFGVADTLREKFADNLKDVSIKDKNLT